MPKFIQICVTSDDDISEVFALDSKGHVWQLEGLHSNQPKQWVSLPAHPEESLTTDETFQFGGQDWNNLKSTIHDLRLVMPNAGDDALLLAATRLTSTWEFGGESNLTDSLGGICSELDELTRAVKQK